MEIKNAKKLTDLKWLNLFDVDYKDKNGLNKSWQVATRASQPKCLSRRFAEPDAVVIVPFHTMENKLVITREYRVALADYEYGFPAGLLDEGESVDQTVRRELMEETGLTLTRVIRTSPPVYSSAGMTDESVAMVYIECSGRPSTAGNTASESIEIDFVSPSQAARLCDNTTLKFDVKAWLVLFNYSKTGHL
ncbi:MAG: NUDIX hydrolase [Desulfobacteraceae bacterium]|nr:NUDIX hydrolase [Desulfobacteraceae bacterium]